MTIVSKKYCRACKLVLYTDAGEATTIARLYGKKRGHELPTYTCILSKFQAITDGSAKHEGSKYD